MGGKRICQGTRDLAAWSRCILGLRQIFIVKNFTLCSKIEKISVPALPIESTCTGDGTYLCRLRFQRSDRWSSTAAGPSAGAFRYRFVSGCSKLLEKTGQGGRPGLRNSPIINQCALRHQSAHARIKDWCKIVLNGPMYSRCYFTHWFVSKPVQARFPEASESQAKTQHWTRSLNLAETQSERSDHKSSPFVPKRTKRDTSCNHKNSMYTRQNGANGVRAIGQGPIQRQG